MKRKVLFFLTVGFCLITSKVFAAPCYGTDLIPAKSWAHGFESYILFDRDLENSYGSVRSYQHFWLLSYGVNDWLTVDLKAGFGSIKQHPVGADEVDYKTNFAGGYGFRVKLYEDLDSRIKAVAGFQHISVHPSSVRLNGVKNRSILDDWQLSFLVSKDFLKLTPYIGVKLSRVDYIHWIEEDRERRMSDLTESLGLVLGVDIPFSNDAKINIESHFFDESAVSFSIMWKL